ncbi:MAG: hypothetical protein NTZ93_00140 [Candidatus Beckwithbacteria bacterium]|nr:hypothetical protein [Candidatus Beckwithbacteria bacterium]
MNFNKRKLFHLCLISFLILFLELLLIRLISAEIRLFAYLSNLILLAIFIGSGLGMLIKKRLPLTLSAILLLILTVILTFKLFTPITNFLSPLSDSFIWFQTPWTSWLTIIWGLILTLFLFALTLAIFIPLGQHLSLFFHQPKQRIWFYSLNVFFSLIGILSFNLASFLNLSPYLGLLLAQFIIFSLTAKNHQNLSMFLTILSIIVISFNLVNSTNTTWSPYQKLDLQPIPNSADYFLQVNNVGYMGLLDLSDNRRQALINQVGPNQLPPDFSTQFNNQYQLPFVFKPQPSSVLIVGAGGGNDAAAAVRNSASRIDAIEIDPQIIKLGQKYHPEQPYSKPTVNLVNNDGRSFFQQTQNKYDLVIMGLADSHTLSGSLNNLQLDNYLYTQESFQAIKNLLQPDGLVFIAFDVRRPWIGAQIQNNLADVFHHQPLVFSLQNDPPIFGWGGVIFVQSLNPDTLSNLLNRQPNLNQFIQKRLENYPQPLKNLTDDWPYLYLDQPRLPKLHLVISGLIVCLFFLFSRKLNLTQRFNPLAFFLGAGFLLFEFQNISKTALLYGNTWQTNVFTISAILILILLANLSFSKLKIPLKLAYLFLIISFIFTIIIPLNWLNQLPQLVKYLVLPFLLNLPLYFSGLIFINLFSRAHDETAFLASNLIGSAIGGLLSFLSYRFGLQSLLFVSLASYLFSLIYTIHDA